MALGSGKSVTQEQQTIHAGEAFEIWLHLTLRYDVQEITAIFHNFSNDVDFKALLARSLGLLEKEISEIEREMNRLGIPMSKRPPRSANTPANREIFRDETMFRAIYMMLQLSLNKLQRTGVIMLDPRLRDIFVRMQNTERDVYTQLVVFGRLKGWMHIPPEY